MDNTELSALREIVAARVDKPLSFAALAAYEKTATPEIVQELVEQLLTELTVHPSFGAWWKSSRYPDTGNPRYSVVAWDAWRAGQTSLLADEAPAQQADDDLSLDEALLKKITDAYATRYPIPAGYAANDIVGEVVRLIEGAPAQQAGEQMTRFCPSCGRVGEVGPEYRDCCPDGSNARMIPEKLAKQCRELFLAALETAAPHPVSDSGARSERIAAALALLKQDYSPDCLRMASTKEYVEDAVGQLIDAGYATATQSQAKSALDEPGLSMLRKAIGVSTEMSAGPLMALAAARINKSSAQPVNADADENAPWLTLAHMICADQGIPVGHIKDRLEVLREKLHRAADDRRDAERYRWLRDKLMWSVGLVDDMAEWDVTLSSPYGVTEDEDSLDAAIDAAIAASKEGASHG